MKAVVRHIAGDHQYMVDIPSYPGRLSVASSLDRKVGAELPLAGKVAMLIVNDWLTIELEDGRRLTIHTEALAG